MTTSVDVQRLAGSCGAIVRGLDVSRPQSPEQIEAILQLLDEHLVITLPHQALDLDRLETFTDELGGRDITPFITPVEGRPHVLRVIKEPSDELNFANAWHTDLTYLTTPPAYTVLHAHDVPVAGGDTMWANQYLAYETLPDSVKHQIADLRATHSAGMAYGTGGYLEAVAGKSSMTVAPSEDAYAVETHPLVIRHPRTGRVALFVNSVYTTGVEGMEPDEARALLARLTAARDASELHMSPALGARDVDDLGQQRHTALRDQRLPGPAPRDVPHQRDGHRASARLIPSHDGRQAASSRRRAASRTTQSSVRMRSAAGGRSPLAMTTPSIMSAITAPRGRPCSRIDTTAPSGRRRIDRSTPTSRGGHR